MERFREEKLQLRPSRIACFTNRTTGPRSMVDAHWHDAFEILLIRQGTGRQQLNAHCESFAPDDIIVIRPGDVHATEALSAGGCDIGVVQFAAEVSAPSSGLHTGLLHAADSDIPRLFDALGEQISDERPGQGALLTGLVYLLTGSLLRRQSPASPAPSPTMNDVCAYLEQADNLSLASTARRFGYTPEHLSRRFHRELGLTYSEYCGRLRMRRAAALLHTGGGSVASAAERLGYGDESSFIRAFRRTYVITPSAYARLIKPMDSDGM